MLHNVLLFLKIWGIVIAVVLGLLVILLVFSLFIPVSYRGRLVVKEEVTGFFRVYFLFPLLRFAVVFKEGKGSIKLYLLGIPVWRMSGDGKQKEKKERIQKKKKKEEKKPKGIFGKIKYTFRKFCVKIKKTWNNSKEVVELLRKDVAKEALGDLKNGALGCIQIIRPRKIEGFLEFGTGDPASTGQILGFISIFYFAYFQDIKLYPNFLEKVLQADLSVKGHFPLFKLISRLFMLYRNRKVKYVFRKIANLGGSGNE